MLLYLTIVSPAMVIDIGHHYKIESKSQVQIAHEMYLFWMKHILG